MIRRIGSTSISPTLCIHSVHTATINKKSLSIPIEINRKNNENVETLGLIDSGAGGEFIDQNYAKKQNLNLNELDKPITAYNVDGTLNKKGTIKYYVDLDLNIYGRKHLTRLYVTGLGKQKVILGFPWLEKHNPIIDWKNGNIEWKEVPRRFLKFKNRQTDNTNHTDNSKTFPKPSIENEVDEEEWKNRTTNILDEEGDDVPILIRYVNDDNEDDEYDDEDGIWINAKSNTAMDLAIEENLKKTGTHYRRNGPTGIPRIP